MRNTFWQGLLAGIVAEAAALCFLLLGKWEFMGEIDWAGKVGILLHYPGFRAQQMADLGNASWLVIIGLPLLLWCTAAWSVVAAWKCARKKTTGPLC